MAGGLGIKATGDEEGRPGRRDQGRPERGQAAARAAARRRPAASGRATRRRPRETGGGPRARSGQRDAQESPPGPRAAGAQRGRSRTGQPEPPRTARPTVATTTATERQEGQQPRRRTAGRTAAAARTASRTGDQSQRPAARAATRTERPDGQDREQDQQPATRTEPGRTATRARPRRRGGGRRNRRRRGRDRDRTARRGATGTAATATSPTLQILEDDVLVPSAGILDVLDNYAFVRTSGYLPGTDDVYVSLSMVRQYGLRRGDAITGLVRQPREGERKEKFNPLVKLDTVNGADPEAAKDRVEFQKLTPLYPQRAAAPRDHADQPDRPRHRHRRPDRQGPARPDRLAVQGRQDDDHAVDRELDHHEQPRVPPDGRARRRASRGGHRLRALGQGRGHLLDLRPPRQRPHHGRRAGDRAGQAAGRARPRRGRPPRRHHPAGPRVQPGGARLAAGSCPAASTPRRSTRRSGSSAPRATSRTAAR